MREIINQVIADESKKNTSIKNYLYDLADSYKLDSNLSKSEIKSIVREILDIVDFIGEADEN